MRFHQRRVRVNRGPACALFLIFAGSAWEPGPITQVDPSEQASGEDPDVPQVERGLFTIHASVDPADSALADSLGWQDGVPGVEIQFLRNGTAEWLTTTTDSTGTASFFNVLPGLYRLFGGRTLTDAEASAVGGVIRAFGDGRTVRIGQSGQFELQLLADRPGSLVISETGAGRPLGQEINWTPVNGSLYFEVYNQSANTLFLDGRILGAGHDALFDFSFMPCTASEPVRNDPEGMYARWFLQFPGSGADYPIEPGEAKLVAAEAIDWTPIHPTMSDLSNADFEIGGLANNPGVPDMLQSGPEGFPLPRFGGGINQVFLAEPFDVASLPVVWRDHNGREFFRVPNEKILDVPALIRIWTPKDAQAEPCSPIVHRSFNRYEGGFVDIGLNLSDMALRSLQRKVLRISPDGRKILMNTNTGAYDFFLRRVPRSPGWIP